MYRVESYDAFHMYEDDEPWMSHGKFATAEEAVAVAKKFTDDWIAKNGESKHDPSKLLDQFLSFGEIVCVFGDPQPDWDAREYVRRRGEELCAPPPKEK